MLTCESHRKSLNQGVSFELGVVGGHIWLGFEPWVTIMSSVRTTIPFINTDRADGADDFFEYTDAFSAYRKA